MKVSGSDRTSAQVSVHGQTVQVASLTGTLKVVNQSGVLLTTIAPGMSFDFTNADAGAPGPQSPVPDPNGNGSQTPSSGGGKGKTAPSAGTTGGASHAWVIGGILITGGVAALASYWATQGVTSPQSCLSPCQNALV